MIAAVEMSLCSVPNDHDDADDRSCQEADRA